MKRQRHIIGLQLFPGRRRAFWSRSWRMPVNRVVAALALCFCCAGPPSASAFVLLKEAFVYGGGSLVGGAPPGLWSTYSGTSGMIDVTNVGVMNWQVNLNQGEPAEDVTTPLAGGPYTNGYLCAAFTVNFSALPNGTGNYIAHFRDAGTNARACVYVLKTGSSYRLGIANSPGTSPVYAANLLSLNTTHRVVVRYNAAAASASLWIDPGSARDQLSPTVTDTSVASAVPVAGFDLCQFPVTPGTGVLILGNLTLATTFTEVWLPWNNWWDTSSGGKWEALDPFGWFWGPPGSGYFGLMIANTNSIGVVIDGYTVSAYPSSLTISNLTLSSSSALATNTLGLYSAGTTNPLRVLNNFVLGSGGALTATDSALKMDGVSGPFPGSFLCLDGTATLNNSSLTASNAAIWIGCSPGVTKGALTLNGGTLLASNLTVGAISDSSGSFSLNSGLFRIPVFGSNAALVVGGLAGTSNAVGTVTINGGLVLLTNGVPTVIGNAGYGSLTMTGGTVRATGLIVGDTGRGTIDLSGGSLEVDANSFTVGNHSGSTGGVYVIGGQLTLSNTQPYIGYDGNGTLLVGSNGVVVATNLSVGVSYSGAGTGTGAVWVVGGLLAVTNAAHTARIDVRRGSLTLNGGLIQMDNLVLTNGGTFTNISGTLQYTAPFQVPQGSATIAGGNVDAASDFVIGGASGSTGTVYVAGGALTVTNGVLGIGNVGSGQMNISSGSVIATQIRLGGSTNGANGVLQLTGGHLTVLSNLCANFIIVGGGDLDGSGGTVVIGQDHDAAMQVDSGTATNIGTLYAGYTAGFTGSFTQNGGLVKVTTNLFVGDWASTAQGACVLNGGTLCVTNAAHTAALVVRNGAFQVNPGATLIADNVVVTNAGGRFFQNGGVVLASNTVLAPGLDADGDGLPNGWEQAHGLDPLCALGDHCAAGDPDHDGQSNLAEYRAGTDPQSRNSVFRMLGATVSGQDVQVTWTTVGGRSYVVQVCTDATGGVSANFVDCSGVIDVGGEGEGTRSYTHHGGAANRGAYYRMRLEP